MRYMYLLFMFSLVVELNALPIPVSNTSHQLEYVDSDEKKKLKTAEKRARIEPIHIPQKSISGIKPVSTMASSSLVNRPKLLSIEYLNRYSDFATYIDGVKILGEANIPLLSIDHLEVMERGIPAEYGDFSFGRIERNAEGYAFIRTEY